MCVADQGVSPSSLAQHDDPLDRNDLATSDDDILERSFISSWQSFNPAYNFHSFKDFAKDHMLVVEPGCGNGGKEKL